MPLRQLLVLAFCALLLAPSAAVAAGPDVDPAEDDLLARINAARAGHPPVHSHPQIAAAAHAQAAWLSGLSDDQRAALTAQAAHCGGPGCPIVRATAAGWPDARTVMGEIIKLGATGGPTVQGLNEEAIAAWQRSAFHSRQLYASGWAYAGIGIVGDVTVVVFAQLCTVGGCVPGGGTGTLLPTGVDGGAGLGVPGPPGLPAAPARTSGADASAPPATGRPVQQQGCAPLGRIRVLRRPSRRSAVEVRMTCKQPGRRYRVRVRDGKRRRVITMRRERTVVPVTSSRRSRWVRVDVDEDTRRLGTVRVRVRGR